MLISESCADFAFSQEFLQLSFRIRSDSLDGIKC